MDRFNRLIQEELSRQERIGLLKKDKNLLQPPNTNKIDYQQIKENPPHNYIELERQLEEIFGADVLAQAYADIEEEHGINGLDAYHSGHFELLFDILDSIYADLQW